MARIVYLPDHRKLTTGKRCLAQRSFWRCASQFFAKNGQVLSRRLHPEQLACGHVDVIDRPNYPIVGVERRGPVWSEPNRCERQVLAAQKAFEKLCFPAKIPVKTQTRLVIPLKHAGTAKTQQTHLRFLLHALQGTEMNNLL